MRSISARASSSGCEGERHLVDERPARVLEAVLREVADRQAGGLDDAAAVGLVEAGEHPEQRRLAGAVRAGKADAIAVGDLPGHVVEQHALAERLRRGLRAES